MHDNTTHNSLAKEFQNGRFGIRRTSKEFSRMPIDLTLQQMINADAASQRTGISTFTNSLAARQRWSQTHFLRMSIVSNLLETLDLNNRGCQCRFKKSQDQEECKDLQQNSRRGRTGCEPFSSDIDKDNLYNIGTGKLQANKHRNFY